MERLRAQWRKVEKNESNDENEFAENCGWEAAHLSGVFERFAKSWILITFLDFLHIFVSQLYCTVYVFNS